MKRILTIVSMSVLLSILDNSLVTFLSVKGYYPSLLFVFVISYSIIQDDNEALWVGIFSGLLQDIYFYHGFGVNTLINMLLCLLAAKIGKGIFKDKKIIPIISVFFLSILKGCFIYGVLYISKIYINLNTILFIALYNMIVSIFIYSYVYKLCTKKFMKKDWKF
ncbi:rod shape-determining protein MreD [Haloimpatiens sp. FM7330]|uniref:rod shape-determining protein MreD n=1 Tax=Haloimpatiens sp. FM7330 TaxID=3298610 RepID=UPI00362CC12E